MLKDKRKDFVLESLSQVDASVGAITTDVQAFKNIRNYLFGQITEDIHKHKNELATLEAGEAAASKKEGGTHERNESMQSEHHKQALTKNKLYLYLFHLFESIVNHVAQLI